jgi:hypothetical protein
LLLIFVFISNLSALAKESVVYSLGPNDSGIQPDASLVADKDGNLYRATSNQEFWGYGAVFELMPNSDGTWTETTLYAFIGGSDGGIPMANLILDKSGNLFGATEFGGVEKSGRTRNHLYVVAFWRHLERSRSPSLQQRQRWCRNRRANSYSTHVEIC